MRRIIKVLKTAPGRNLIKRRVLKKQLKTPERKINYFKNFLLVDTAKRAG